MANWPGRRFSSEWDESKHPRVPKGSGDPSGEFTRKGGGVAAASWESGDPLPENAYLHGRAGRADLDTGNVILATKDEETARMYGGKRGSVWLLAIEDGAVKMDVTDPGTVTRIARDLATDYEARRLNAGLEDLIGFMKEEHGANWRRVFKAELDPPDLVNSAGFFDDSNFVEWFGNRYEPDVVLTSGDGAVFFEHERRISARRVYL